MPPGAIWFLGLSGRPDAGQEARKIRKLYFTTGLMPGRNWRNTTRAANAGHPVQAQNKKSFNGLNYFVCTLTGLCDVIGKNFALWVGNAHWPSATFYAGLIFHATFGWAHSSQALRAAGQRRILQSSAAH